MPYTPEHDDEATQIDSAPHWSSVRQSLVGMKAAPAKTRAQTVRPELAARVVPKRPPPLPVPPRLPPAVQRRAITPAAPLPVVAATSYMLPFYSHAEAQPQYGVETERVDPLPMSSLRPDWYVSLAKLWSRYAAVACGAIAGLIFVVGYLAYASQNRAAIASAAVPAPRIVMPVEVAVAEPVAEPAPLAVRAPTIPEPAVTEVADEAAIAKPVKRQAAKRVATKQASKRRPIHLNDSTPLGDLRPSRSR